MANKIIIFGQGGHAKVVADAIKLLGHFDILCFLAKGDALDEIIKNNPRGVVAIGDNVVRQKVVNDILSINPSFEFISVVHPTAVVAADVVMGCGSVVMAGVVINTGTKVGDHAVLNTGAIVEHDCLIGDYAFVGPGAVLGGQCEIGEKSFIGIGAKAVQAITVGSNTMVGAGSTLTKNLPKNILAIGSPCRTVRQRKLDEPFLGKTV